MTWLGYASGASHAVDVTPAGIPVVGAVMALGVLAFLVWDALRAPVSPGSGGWSRQGSAWRCRPSPGSGCP
ncbi:hypothetical protein [Streptomyces sp. N1]|uniref:hypothetical protein n=1 Tax=Streptomyces sp. N1 TaxID=576456 RepID=UPI001F5139F1|nr:hypothetical protein [Streptomyces sp. N1]